MSLKGKVALVTGGSKGIGLAISRALLKDGAEVVLCGRDSRALEAAATELGAGAIPLVCDVCQYSQVQQMFAVVDRRFSGLDVLINNAGVGIFAPVSELTVAQWHAVVDTNLTGTFYCCREAIPLMRRRGGGYIINVSSLAGKNAFAGAAAYNASKFGLNGFSEALMLDVRYDNIRVSYVMPGSVETEFAGGSAHGTWKLQAGDVAQTVVDLLHLPQNALASRVEMRPLQPPRQK